MENRVSSVLFTILLVLFITAGSLGCSCLHDHPQTKYCSADFVIKFKVLQQDFVLKNKDGSMKPVELDSPPERFLYRAMGDFKKPSENPLPQDAGDGLWYRAHARYLVGNIEVFKGKEVLELSSVKYMYSALDEGRCGVLLHTGVIYYYMGNLENGQIEISRCQFLVPSNMYTDEELNTIRSNIMNEWPQGCQTCNIIQTCEDSYLPDICVMESMFVFLGVDSILKDTCVLENLILDMDKTFADTACIEIDNKCMWVVIGENNNVYLPDFPIDVSDPTEDAPPIPDAFDPDAFDETLDYLEKYDVGPPMKSNMAQVDYPFAPPKVRSLEINLNNKGGRNS